MMISGSSSESSLLYEGKENKTDYNSEAGLPYLKTKIIILISNVLNI